LNVETLMTAEKALRRVKAVHADTGEALEAYEIHTGRTEGEGASRPFATVEGRSEGAVSADGLISGTYLHGLFSSDAFRTAFLARLGIAASGEHHRAAVQNALDALAGHIETHLDIDGLLALAR